MNPNDTFRLLILNDSRDEAERLISMLQNAGRSTRSQYVENEEVLTKLLQEQAWDLLIGDARATNVPPSSAIKQIKRLKKDVPVILLTDEEGSQPAVEGMKMGAQDVVRIDEDQHLLLVIQRELENHEQRQQKRRSERQFKEAERRSQQLLDSSRDAIAYVQDGMYLYANESFADMFGYDDREDLECMPIIDMISDPDQDKAKVFMKEFALKGEEGESSQLAFSGVRPDGSITPVTVEVANAIYDEEPCIQFLARAQAATSVNNEALEAQLNEIKHQDTATGLYNRQYMVNQLKQVLASTDDSQQSGAFLTLEVDNFADAIQSVLGVSASDQALASIAKALKEKCSGDQQLARFGDNSFSILIPSITADDAVKFGAMLCKTVEDHIIDVDGRTLQTTLSVGISIISDTSTNSEEVIEQSMKAVASIAAGTDSDAGNKALLFEPEVSTDAETDMSNVVQTALEKDQFKLLFQPIISLRGSEEEHYEVLLRMVTDEGEEVSPHTFLEAAEQIGAHIKIDRWVILESIKMLSEHNKKGNKTQLIVNLTRHSMMDKSLLPWLGVAFKAAGLTGQSIIFQISEADITNHLNAAKDFLSGLAEMGCSRSISNFGCALNPFNTLKHVDVDFVKVDGSFTLDIQNNSESPETLTNLLKELHAENKITVVPFVENASVLSTLWQAGTHYIQGHYLQAPADDMNYDFSMDS
ncbi:cyclic di-GMP-binding protein FimX [Aurantivibrio plasticivorans]